MVSEMTQRQMYEALTTARGWIESLPRRPRNWRKVIAAIESYEEEVLAGMHQPAPSTAVLAAGFCEAYDVVLDESGPWAREVLLRDAAIIALDVTKE